VRVGIAGGLNPDLLLNQMYILFVDSNAAGLDTTIERVLVAACDVTAAATGKVIEAR
jgi:hypothetical protein